MMEREEQPLLYIYEVIKKDNPTNDVVGDWMSSINDNPSAEFYRPVGTFRKAFIGDMQEKFDMAYARDNMRNFAEKCGQGKNVVFNKYIIKYRKPVSLYRKVKRKILLYFRERSATRYFDEIFYKKQKNGK